MKYLEFGTEHPELMVILHGGGICYRAADIVHSDVLGEYIRDGAALGTFDFDALAPDIAYGTVGDDHLRNLPNRLQPDADARADRGERTVGDMHILHGTAAGLHAKVTLVSSTVVPGVTAYCIIGIQLFGNWRLVFGIGSNASGAGRVLCAAVRRTGAVCRQGKAGIERLTGQRACDGMAADMPLGTKGDSVTICTPGSGAQTARRPFAVIDQLSGLPFTQIWPRYRKLSTESGAASSSVRWLRAALNA